MYTPKNNINESPIEYEERLLKMPHINGDLLKYKLINHINTELILPNQQQINYLDNKFKNDNNVIVTNESTKIKSTDDCNSPSKKTKK